MDYDNFLKKWRKEQEQKKREEKKAKKEEEEKLKEYKEKEDRKWDDYFEENKDKATSNQEGQNLEDDFW